MMTDDASSQRSTAMTMKSVALLVVCAALLLAGLTEMSSLQEAAPSKRIRGNNNERVLVESTKPVVPLDFFVAGFPKCGTTSLLQSFEVHNETAIPDQESCSILDQGGSDDNVLSRMMDELSPLEPQRDVKRGIKCPTGLKFKHTVDRLQRLYPDTKLIFGMRHPVSYFQSFYNYRVLIHHKQQIQNITQDPIPSVESLLNHSWQLVSVDSARYEDTLKNLGKAQESESSSTSFTVFLYTLEQLQDKDDERRQRVRDALASFLDLKNTLLPLPHGNRQTKVFDETINICDTKFEKVRNALIEQGKETQRWIQEEFINSPDVTVANEEHFRQLVETFGSDPCLTSTH